MIRRWFAGLRPFTILLIGWCVFLVYAYPGQVTLDSIDQLTEARAGYYTDSHPAMMAALWRIVDWFVAGPFGMIIIQSATFLAGFYLVLRRAMQPRHAAIAAVLVFFFPPVLTPMSVVWKDCVMAGFLSLGCGLLLEQSRWLRIAGLVSLGLGASVRYNALAATLPVIVILFTWRHHPLHLAPTLRGRIQRYAISSGAWIAVTLATFGVNGALTDREMYIWHSSLAVMDIAGTLRYVERDIPDEELRVTFADTGLLTDKDLHATLRTIYSPRDFAPVMSEPTGIWSLPIQGTVPAPKVQRDAIARAWWDVITDHPTAYLRHRTAVFIESLALTKLRPAGAVTPRPPKFPPLVVALDLGTRYSTLQDAWTGALRWLWRWTPIFRQWIYFVVSIILLVLCRRHRDVFALLLSGLAMESTLFFLAPSPDYRYSHWMVVCAVLAIVMLTARRARQGAEPASADSSGV